MTMEGSVSDDSVLKTDVLQSIECACLRGVGRKDWNESLRNILHSSGRHNKLASLTNSFECFDEMVMVCSDSSGSSSSNETRWLW